MSKIVRITQLGFIILILQACETPQQSTPPAMPPSSMPPSTSSPSSRPPSQESSPSTSRTSTSKPSIPSAPSSSPSSPNPTTQGKPPSNQPPSTAENRQPAPSSPGGQNHQEAAEQLKTIGQEVAEKGQNLPAIPGQAGTEGEWDPLMPDAEKSDQSESDIFGEDIASSGKPETSADLNKNEQSDPDSSKDPANPWMPDSSASSAESPESSSHMETGIAEKIQAAREALENAGVSMERAGEILETAQTTEELAEAEAALARARVAIIVAGQDLLDLEEAMPGPENEQLIQEAQGALNDANTAIVVATNSVFSSRIDLPEFEKRQAQGAGGGETQESELEKELNDSIIVFENEIMEARAEVIGSAPPPTSAENIPGVAVLGGNIKEEPETLEENEGDPIAIQEIEENQQGTMPAGEDLAVVEEGTSAMVPDDVPDPQGDDIVAQQLREAAISETDPDLRDKLWDEYKRYKAGL